MANVTEQTRTAQINSFTGGINTDLHPLLQPNDTLIDCINGTLITYNGNENMLQNDMGNYQLRNAKLPEGYIPMGMKEHQGILYLALYNPITKKVQLGSYPSPQTDFSKNGEVEEFELSPIEIGVLVDPEGDKTYVLEHSDTDALPLEEKVWKLIESNSTKTSKFLYSQLDKSKSTVVFTKDYSDESTFAVGDKYLISHEVSSDGSEETPFQKLKHFVINEDKKTYDVDTSDIKFSEKADVETAENDPEDYDTVTWEQQGWLGAKYEIDDVGKIEQDVNVSFSRYVVKDYSKYSKTTDDDQYTHNFALHKLDTNWPNLKDFIESESCAENQMIILDGTSDFEFTDSVEVINGFTYDFGNGNLYFKGLSILDNTPKYQTLIDGSFDKKIIVLDKITSNSRLPAAVSTELTGWGLWVKGECNLSKIRELKPDYLFLGPNSNIVGNLDSSFNISAYVPESIDTSKSGNNVTKYTVSEDIEKVFASNLPAIYYGLSTDVQDIKIGLTGTWNIESNVYTCKDTDSIAAIEGFLSSVQNKNLVILLPKNKVVTKLYPNSYVVRSGYKEKFDFIIEDSEVVIYCDDENIKPQEEVQNVTIYPIWKLQFGNVQIAQESLSSTIPNALKISNVEISRNEDETEDILSVSVQKGFDTQLDLFKKKYTDKTDRCTSVPINSGSIYYLSADTNPVNVYTGLRVINHYSKKNNDKTFGIITYLDNPGEIISCSSNVEEIIIPGSVNLIKTDAFNGCYNLKHIQIFDEDYYGADFKIETDAFHGCTNLKKLVINRCLTLESEAFNNSGISQLICQKLYLEDAALDRGTALKIWTTELELDEGLNPDNCMRNVTVCLNSPYWKYSSVSYYLNYVNKYSNTPVTAAKIIPPEGMYLEYTIGGSSQSSLLDASAVKVGKCFQNYKHNGRWWITYDEIPKQLPDQMFKDIAIDSISIPEGVKTIPWNCFSGCSLLKKLVFPDSVETIESGALPDSLSEVTFGRNFTGNISLHVSGAPNNPPVIARFKCKKAPLNFSLSGTTSRKLIFITPADNEEWNERSARWAKSWTKEWYKNDASARAYKTITLDANVTLWGNNEGFEKSFYKADNNIYITDSNITNIPEKLFVNTESGDINIDIPSGIKSICEGKLNQLALLPYKDVTINLPEGIERLGHKALEFNSNDTTRSIKKINFPASITRVEEDMLERFPYSMEIYTNTTLFSKEFSGWQSSDVTIPYEYAHTSRIYSTKFSSTCSEDPYELVRLVNGFVNVGGTHVVAETEDVVFSPRFPDEPWFENVVLNYDWNSSETLEDYGLYYVVPEQFYGYSAVNNVVNGVYIGEDSVKYSFLFDKTKLSKKFLFWKTDNSKNIRKVEKTLDYEYSPSKHSTYVVPDPTNVLINDRYPLRSDYKLEKEFVGGDAKNYIMEFNINVSGQTSKVSTKIDIDGEYQLYEDLSSGTYRNLIRRSQFPNTITVSSVPYNYIESSGHCLIYDNLKTSDVFNLNPTGISDVSKFQYKCTDEKITVMLETTDTNDLTTVDQYIDLYKINSGRLSKIACAKKVLNRTTENVDVNLSSEIDIEFTLEGDSVDTSSFGFIQIELSGATTYLPIYFGMTESKCTQLCEDNHIDFSKLYFDELGIENSNQNATYSCEITHPYIFKDYNKNIVFQSKRPFLWHSVKDYFDTNYGYYGCARKENVSINLSKFKLVDGNRYSIKLGNSYLERNKEFHPDDTTLQNAEGDIVWTGQVINGQNVTKYTREVYAENDSNHEFCDTICKRDYMLKYAGCPMTVNVEKEYGWTKEMADYAGWTDVGNINSLFISKSAGKNPYVRIGVDSINNLKNSDNGHSKAIECTSSTQVLNKVKQAHSDMDGGTTQFVTPVICKLTTKKNGFILPIPKDWTKFSYFYNKTLNNKKNRGTDSAVVLTRQTRALQIDQAIFQAFMSLVSAGVVVGGVMGGIAIALALGIAAVSAVGMAIPIVGWAVAVAAALTACVYAIINYCKGVDQKFDFYALKGTGNNLIMPIWGKVDVKNRGTHPFYTNVDPNMIEKMLLFLYTRVYRISSVEESGGHLEETDEIEVVNPQPLTLELYGRSLETRFDFVQECINLAKLLNINTNNFTEKNPKEFEEIVLSTTNTHDVENRFKDIIRSQQLTNKEDVEHIGEFSFERCSNNGINNNVSRFVSNLTLNEIDNSDSWAYDINKGTINTYDQECFGGNRGGCNVDLKVAGWGNSWFKRLMSGEFPHKKDGFIPVAYPAKVDEDPILSICPTDIYAEHIYKIDRENNRDDEYLTWVVNSNEI